MLSFYSVINCLKWRGFVKRYISLFLLTICSLFLLLFHSESFVKAANIKKPIIKQVQYNGKWVKVSWKKVKKADEYIILRANQKKGTYEPIASTQKKSIKDKNILRGETYYYKVAALKGEQKQKISAPKKITITSTKKSNDLVTPYPVVPDPTSLEDTKQEELDNDEEPIEDEELEQDKELEDIELEDDEELEDEEEPEDIELEEKDYEEDEKVDIGLNGTDEFAKEVLSLVNKERKKAGLSELSYDETLFQAADMRAKELNAQFSHTRPDGTNCFTILKEYQISYSSCGENIASGYSIPESVVDGWMNSEGHRANIMNPSFTKLGVGYYNNNWVQLFIQD